MKRWNVTHNFQAATIEFLSSVISAVFHHGKSLNDWYYSSKTKYDLLSCHALIFLQFKITSIKKKKHSLAHKFASLPVQIYISSNNIHIFKINKLLHFYKYIHRYRRWLRNCLSHSRAFTASNHLKDYVAHRWTGNSSFTLLFCYVNPTKCINDCISVLPVSLHSSNSTNSPLMATTKLQFHLDTDLHTSEGSNTYFGSTLLHREE